MKAGHIEIFVKDSLKSKEFYINKLGFKLITVQKNKFVWLKSGGVEFLLRPGVNISKFDKYNKSKMAIVLYTTELDKKSVELAMKGIEFKGTDGNDRCLTFTDPDGNWFQLVNPEEQ